MIERAGYNSTFEPKRPIEGLAFAAALSLVAWALIIGAAMALF